MKRFMETQRLGSSLLAVAVLVPLIFIGAVYMPIQYRAEVRRETDRKHTSLDGEALTLSRGIGSLGSLGGVDSVQKHINQLCSDMHESTSPGRHVAVRWKGDLLYANSHDLNSARIALAIQQENPALPTKQDISIGRALNGDVEVFVSEDITDVRHSIRKEKLLQLMLLTLGTALGFVGLNVAWRQLVALPVASLSRTVSRITGSDFGVKVHGAYSREIAELSGAIQHLSMSLAAGERSQNAGMDRARRVQENLLPRDMAIDGLSVAYSFQPVESVAGDYYDLIRLPDGTWLICIADVAGHGVAAALGAAMLKALLLTATDEHSSPSEILNFLNNRLAELLPDEFITMFLARWDFENGQIEYASAGHDPGFLFSKDGCVRQLAATGLPLGVSPLGTWELVTIRPSQGQRLLLTTDGIAEASNPRGELFGRDRLQDLCKSLVKQPLDDLVENINSQVSAHRRDEPAQDDVTIVAVEFSSNRGSTDGTGDPLYRRRQDKPQDLAPRFRRYASSTNLPEHPEFG